jgi:hypothetical protein
MRFTQILLGGRGAAHALGKSFEKMHRFERVVRRVSKSVLGLDVADLKFKKNRVVINFFAKKK